MLPGARLGAGNRRAEPQPAAQEAAHGLAPPESRVQYDGGVPLDKDRRAARSPLPTPQRLSAHSLRHPYLLRPVRPPDPALTLRPFPRGPGRPHTPCHPRLARGAAHPRGDLGHCLARLQQPRAGGAVDGAVNAAAAQHALIGCTACTTGRDAVRTACMLMRCW